METPRTKPLTGEGFHSRQPLAFVLGATIFLSVCLLFAGLGHYALWDDEAIDAFMARGLLRSGDTVAMVDGNLMGYRGGSYLLHNMRVEGEPPFTAYVVAISMLVFGENSFAARWPIALFGFATVVLMSWWLWREKVSAYLGAVFGIALLGNVSFFLFSRQCHYYGTAMFCFVAIAYIYLHWRKGWLQLLAMGVVSAVLLASNYSFYVLLYLCIFADYLLWQRKVSRLGISDIWILFLPQVLVGLAIVAWWNPFHTQLGTRMVRDSALEHGVLFLWHWRDLNACEFFSAIVLLAAFAVAFWKRDRWLKRGLFAMVLYVIVATIITPQSIKETSVSDVRYFVGLIPLFLIIQVLTIWTLGRERPWMAILAALLVFATNLGNGVFLTGGGLHSTPARYIAELINQPGDPYNVTQAWIRQNIEKGASIWVLPAYMTYPLMFHAPAPVYAWQLAGNQRSGQFANLPPVHFQGQSQPEYIIVFGPVVQQVASLLDQWSKEGVHYQITALLDFYWKDVHRPELFWRSFEQIQEFDSSSEAIYVFKKTTQGSKAGDLLAPDRASP